MKKMLSILLSLIMVLGMLPTVWGETEATSLPDAVNGVITLTQNVTISSAVAITEDTVIEGKGFTLTYAGNGDRVITAENTANGADLTVKDLTIKFQKDIARGINYNTTGKLTLQNVTVGDATYQPTYAVNLPSSSDGAQVEITDCVLFGKNTVNIWGEDMVIDITDTDITSVDKSSAEGYVAIYLNNDGVNAAEGTVVNVVGGTITAKDQVGATSIAVSNATSTGTVNFKDPPPEVEGVSNVPVAVIRYSNNTAYSSASLASLVKKATANDVITLINDVTLDANITVPCPIVVDTEIEFDLNGKDIAFDGDGFIIEEGGKLTIEGEGNISAGNVVGCWVAVWAKGGDTVINGGNWSMANLDENGEGNSLIYSKGGDITINDGYFNSENTFNNYGTPWYYVINRNNNYDGVIVVNGGTFENYDPSLSDDVLGEPPYLAEGYVSVAAADGKSYTVHKHTVEAVEAEEGDCLKDGVKAHYTCKGCGKLYEDAAGTKEVEAADLVVKGGHKLTEVKAKDATYTEAGNKAHYVCSVCGKLFEDAEGETETTAAKVTVPQLIYVEEEKAEVSTGAVDAAIKESKEEESVILDLTHKDVVGEENVDAVSQAQLPVASLEAVAAEDKPLTLVKEDAAVSIAPEALEAIADQAGGETVTLVVESVKVEDLEEKQQEAVEDKEVAIVISAELICDATGKKLATEADGGFGGGKVAVAVPLPATLPEGTKAEDYKVYYVDDAGKVTEIESEVQDGIVVFVLEHFSKYVIAAEKPDGSPDTGDYSNVALYSAMAMLSVLGMGVVVLKKKAF